MNGVPASIELIKEWSIWLVGIQTTAIGLLATLYEKGALEPFSKTLISVSVLLFALSILFASWTLGALPDLVSRMDPDSQAVHDLPAFRKLCVPLWVFTAIQHWCFIFGILSFALSVVTRMKWTPTGRQKVAEFKLVT